MKENRLIDLREKEDFKAITIANKLNVSKVTYSLWENNKTPIPTKRIVELADYYKVNIDYLLNLSNKKKYVEKDTTNLNLENIGKNLEEIRNHLGLSLRKLGSRINYSSSALCRYEQGKCLIKSEPLIILCQISNYSIDWVLGRSNEKFIK